MLDFPFLTLYDRRIQLVFSCHNSALIDMTLNEVTNHILIKKC